VSFVKSWWPIYADDPHWVPPLIMERKDFFNPKKNPYFQIADVAGFIAVRDGTTVGTICATVDAELQKTEPGVGMFGFFEFVDDEDVSKALFAAASDWLESKGMKTARGPFNLSPNHEFGLLVDGFDTDPMIANPHNRDYYQRHYEAAGLVGVMDWYAYWIDKGTVPPKIKRIAERILSRNDSISLRRINLSDFESEASLFWEIYNDAWEENWGHVHITEEEFRFMAKNLKQVMNPDLCWFIYVGDDVAGASITLPDFNQVAKKMNGRIFPFGWFHYLTGKGKIDALRVFVLGVKKKYQRLGVGAPLYLKTWEEGEKLDIRGVEASLVLENNHRMRGALEKLGGRIYKTYRTYELGVTPEDAPTEI
jgi:GNAT superfamily N-acetyltransferase